MIKDLLSALGVLEQSQDSLVAENKRLRAQNEQLLADRDAALAKVEAMQGKLPAVPHDPSANR
jgi:regulator of replication initiation timing